MPVPIFQFIPTLLSSLVNLCFFSTSVTLLHGLPKWLKGREPAWQCRNCRTRGFDPWVGKIPGEGNGNLLQYSCLGNPMDRGAWRATTHRVAKSQTRLSWP